MAVRREEILRNCWLRATAGLPSLGTDAMHCNVCGWRGKPFLSHGAVAYVDRNSFCPRCRSYPRHRGFTWIWNAALAAELSGLKACSGLKIVFAPEPGVLQVVGAVLGRLAGVDLAPGPLIEYEEDLQRLSFPDRSVDFASCFHVPEHVPDDRRALSELRRVLSDADQGGDLRAEPRGHTARGADPAGPSGLRRRSSLRAPGGARFTTTCEDSAQALAAP